MTMNHREAEVTKPLPVVSTPHHLISGDAPTHQRALADAAQHRRVAEEQSQELAAARATLDAMVRSRSWRLGAPVRALGRALRRR